MRKLSILMALCLITFFGYGQDVDNSAMVGTYEGERNISLDKEGGLMYQRATTPLLELKKTEDDLYEIVIPPGVRAPNEIPKVRFIMNDKKEVTAIEMVYKDGKKDGPFKKVPK